MGAGPFTGSSVLTATMIVAQTLVPILMLAHGLRPRRMARWARIAITLALVSPVWLRLVFAISSGTPFDLSGYLQVFVPLIILEAAAVYLTRSTSIWSALFCTSAGYTIQNTASSFQVLLGACAQALGLPFPTGAALAVLENAVFIVFCVIFYRIFIKPVRQHRYELVEDRFMLATFVASIFLVIAFDILIKGAYTAGLDTATYIGLRVIHIAVCAFVLFSEYRSLASTRFEAEAALGRQIIEERGRQYEENRAAIELVNKSIHDICHEVAENVKTQQPDNLEELDELIAQALSGISIYDASFKTGSEPVDTALTEKGMLARKEGARLLAMADGKLLDFMTPAEAYTLVSGLLDEVLERLKAASALKGSEISLFIRSKGELVGVLIEYPACKAAAGKSQTDRALQLVVERYGGEIARREDGAYEQMSAMLARP